MMSVEETINRLKPSVVRLQVGRSTGTGFVVSRDGHVLTCNHVASSAEAEVVSQSGRRWTTSVLAREPKCDLAMLQVKGISCDPVPFADPAGISEGQTVYALGHPLGLDFTVSRGVVSNRNRTTDGTTFVQTDVSLNPGNSGGAIVNEDGYAIGVADWIIEEGRGLGFAIALRHIFAFAAKLRIRLIRGCAFREEQTFR